MSPFIYNTTYWLIIKWCVRNPKKILINWWMNERFRINDWSCGWLLEQNVATDWFGKMASTWAESETSHILHPKEGERQHRSVKFVPWLEYNKTYLKIKIIKPIIFGMELRKDLIPNANLCTAFKVVIKGVCLI